MSRADLLAAVGKKSMTKCYASKGCESWDNDASAQHSEAIVWAARARLAAAAAINRRQRGMSAAHYYGSMFLPEEIIDEVPRSDEFDARLTRNHYGSLVLNAARAMFIDVDLLTPSRSSRVPRERGAHLRGPWRRTLDDLRAVMSHEKEVGFRIYRTAAGYRVLATTCEFDPMSARSQQLMQAAGADTAFMYLCRVQKSFRARLTPKPWRCGASLPPNSFPRQTSDERSCFADWLAHYERACRNRATCQFVEHVGPLEMHGRIRSIVELHDRETKAFEPLPLA